MGMMMSTRPAPLAQRVDETPSYDAQDLTGQDGLARIVLNDQIYTLRITRAGKLILTK